MELEELIIFVIIIALLILGINWVSNEQKKELEIIKNNKDYEVYKNCIEVDEEWYCYD